MKKYGTKTTDARRRCNLRKSAERLRGILSANFTGNDKLVTLTYDTVSLPRSVELARCYLRDWLRVVGAMRQEQGWRVRYVYVIEQDGGQIMHRIVINNERDDLTALCALWPYGVVKTEPLKLEDGCAALAALLMRKPMEAGRAVTPCGRSWVPSIGLIRTDIKKGRTV